MRIAIDYEFWDDETLHQIAKSFGKPTPSCNNIRQQIKQRLLKAKVGDHITTDGEKVFVFKGNKQSLRFAFTQIKNKQDPDGPLKC